MTSARSRFYAARNHVVQRGNEIEYSLSSARSLGKQGHGKVADGALKSELIGCASAAECNSAIPGYPRTCESMLREPSCTRPSQQAPSVSDVAVALSCPPFRVDRVRGAV